MSPPTATPPRLIILVLLSGLSVLSLNMFIPSLPSMAADFEVDYALVSLAISGYMLMTTVLQLILGPLSDRFGRRPVLLAGLALFTLASLVCALTANIWVFLTFRVLQGAIVAGWAVSMAVIRDTVPAREAASRMGYISMSMALAPMLGPLLGGGLDEVFGWRANFLTYCSFGLIMLMVCWAALPETNTNRSPTFGQQFRSYPELLRSRRYWGFALCTAFSTGAFYAFIAGAPLVATAVFGMSAAMLGACVGSISGGFMLGSFVSSRIARRFALTTMMLAGRTVACVGLASGLVLAMLGYVHPVLFFGSTIFVGIGNGLTMPSSNAGALSVRPKLAGSAAGLSGALTVAGGAGVTWFTGQVVSEASGTYTLLSIMLLWSFIGLLAALYARRAEARD